MAIINKEIIYAIIGVYSAVVSILLIIVGFFIKSLIKNIQTKIETGNLLLYKLDKDMAVFTINQKNTHDSFILVEERVRRLEDKIIN